MEDVSEVASQLVKVRIDWSEAETGQAPHVNQALGQVGPPGTDGMPDGIYVTIGSLAPPPLLEGDDDVRDRLLEKLTTRGAKVTVVSQVHMSRQMLGDFIAILQVTAANYDAAVRHVAAQGPVTQQGGDSG